MKLIINGFQDSSQLEIINKLIKNFDFEYIHHISSDGALLDPRPGTIIQTSLFYLIGDGQYDFSDCPPLDAEVLEKMLPYEPMIMKMMDRLELYSNKGYHRYKKRRELYLKHLRYWDNLLKSKRIDLFISQNVPHEVYDYVIYALCKIYQIPVLSFFQTQMHDTTFIISDINDWSSKLLLEYEKLSLNPPQNYSESVESEWAKRVNHVEPFYMARNWLGYKNSGTILNIKRKGNKNRLKKILNPIELIKFISFFTSRLYHNQKLYLLYNLVSKQPDYTKKYIYFPLHLQPELTTCPLGGVMENQTLVAEMIAKALPADFFLYIKENPKQTYLGRGAKYYQEILKNNKNIIFVSRNSDTYKLIKHSQAVATVTGTAGWEALFEHKPVLVFGHCFYEDAPGVSKIRSEEDCSAALENIISHKFNYEEIRLKIFLQAVANVSLNACSDPAYFCSSSISIAESNNRLFNFMEKYLKNF